MQGLSSDVMQFFLVKNNLLTSVHNDADATDDANNYNRVIGMALLKAFSCANKKQEVSHKAYYDIEDTGRLTKGSLKKTTAKMATEQSMTCAIMQVPIKATKAGIMVLREADIPLNNARPVHAVPRSGSQFITTQILLESGRQISRTIQP